MVKYPESCCFRCKHFNKLSGEMGLCLHENGQANTGSYSCVIRKTEGTLCPDFEKKKRRINKKSDRK